MAEYIEREATYEDFEKCNSENPKWAPSRVKTLISRQKAADVAPVLHGRWESIPNTYICVAGKDGSYHGYATSCSVCHEINPNAYKTNYCPNCGSKMDEEGRFVGICEHCAYREDCEWPKIHPKIKLKECQDFNKGDKK